MCELEPRIPPRSRAPFGRLVGAVLSLVCAAGLAADGPELSLDTTELVADIRETRGVADSVEQGLQTALDTLARHTDKLREAGCEVGDNRPECRDMKAAMRGDYLTLLDGIETRLPALRSSVTQVVDNLKERMARETGMSASDIQDEIVGARPGGGGNRPSLQGVSGSRLSESLGKLQGLVSGAASGQVSLRAIQSDLYLDMNESLEVIGALQADIDRTRILAELQLGEMQVSDAQMRTAEQAREHLFGERDAVLPAPAMAPGQDEGDFTSPLEFK